MAANSERLISLDSTHPRFLALLKSKKILGVNSTTCCFRNTYRIKEMHNKPKFTKTPKMAILARCYLLGLRDIVSKEGIVNKKYQRDLINADLDDNNNKPISFRMIQYERQLFYLKSTVYSSPAEVMRNLYKIDFSKINWNNTSKELLKQLCKGIDVDMFFLDIIRFNHNLELFSFCPVQSRINNY